MPDSAARPTSLTLDVKAGWHVYANPTGVEGIAPTRVTLDPGQGATLARVDYPAGVTFLWTFEHPDYQGLLSQPIQGGTNPVFHLVHR